MRTGRPKPALELNLDERVHKYIRVSLSGALLRVYADYFGTHAVVSSVGIEKRTKLMCLAPCKLSCPR